jgi:hypothetical protein
VHGVRDQLPVGGQLFDRRRFVAERLAGGAGPRAEPVERLDRGCDDGRKAIVNRRQLGGVLRDGGGARFEDRGGVARARDRSGLAADSLGRRVQRGAVERQPLARANDQRVELAQLGGEPRDEVCGSSFTRAAAVGRRGPLAGRCDLRKRCRWTILR